jgi:DNA-binding response OmpR family regulator
MKKILVVEDDNGVRVPLVDQLQREGYLVQFAPSGVEADQEILKNPDLVVMDWMLPDTQGIELLKKWRGQGIFTPTILLTARTDLVDKVLGLELGANDYMTKPFEVRELIARIRVLLRPHNIGHFRHEGKIQVGDIAMLPTTREIRYCGKITEFTKTEFELLRLFLENPNQVFSREELLKKVWGYENYPTTRTVDTHVLQLRQKLKSDYFETVHGIGYRFRADA